MPYTPTQFFWKYPPPPGVLAMFQEKCRNFEVFIISAVVAIHNSCIVKRQQLNEEQLDTCTNKTNKLKYELINGHSEDADI